MSMLYIVRRAPPDETEDADDQYNTPQKGEENCQGGPDDWLVVNRFNVVNIVLWSVFIVGGCNTVGHHRWFRGRATLLNRLWGW